jgi:hippurate hydrolase
MHAEAIRALLPAEIRTALPEALELYLRFHRFPELSGHERQTAAGFAAALEEAGYRATAGVGGHGVVGVLRNGDGPAVMLRAELDALPVAERTGLPYASTVQPATASGDDGAAMHACGHDAHAACVVGAARVLARLAAHWSGTLIVIGQPAEETLAGAKAMLLDGLYSRFPRPDVVLAQHVAPFPAGLAAHGEGIMLAASVTVDVVVTGPGGHAATTRLTANPIEVAVAAVSTLRQLVAADGGGEADAADGREAVVSIGSLHAGTSANVIPGEARVSVTMRCRDESRLAEMTRALAAILRERQRAGDVEGFRVCERSRSAVTASDSRYGPAVRRVHESLLGRDRVMAWPVSMATEDFSLFGPAGTSLYGGPEVPVVYWGIGCVGPERWQGTVPGGSAQDKIAALPPNHSGRFAVDPVPTIRAGITTMASAALGLLDPASPSSEEISSGETERHHVDH